MAEDDNKQWSDIKIRTKFITIKIEKDYSSDEEMCVLKRENDQTYIPSHSPRVSATTNIESQGTDRQETDRQETARQKTERQETAHQETDRQETARQEIDRQETARQEIDRQETAHQEIARQETGRQEANRLNHIIRRCGMCGYIMHTHVCQNCPARRRRCNNCNRMGHYRAFCWSEPRFSRLHNAFPFYIPAMARPVRLQVRSCDSCGYRVHTRVDRQCPALFKRCFRCHRFGHFRVVCSSPRRQPYFPVLDARSKALLLAAIRVLLE